MITTTRHSGKRCKQRLGHGNVDKVAENALRFGIRYYETSGSLRRYLGSLYESHDRTANNIIVYNRDVYIFNDTTLFTVFHLPNKYYATYDKIQKKKNHDLEGIINDKQ